MYSVAVVVFVVVVVVICHQCLLCIETKFWTLEGCKYDAALDHLS